MHLQIQPSVDIASVHPSVFPPLETPASPELPPPEPRTAAATRKRFKHGLHSQHAVVPGESPKAFRAFRDAWIEDLRPVDAEECALVEQMIVAQWRLKRLWATQTGVYDRFESRYPERDWAQSEFLAECFRGDCVHDRNLDTLSLHEVRLVNIFHRCGRRLDLLRDQRRKMFSRPKGRPFPGEEVFYGEPDAAPAPAPPAILETAETAATSSIDAGSVENADRRDAARADRPGADRDPPLQGPTPAEVGSPSVAEAAPANSQRPDALADAGNATVVGADRDPPPRDWRAAVDRTALPPPATNIETALSAPPASVRTALSAPPASARLEPPTPGECEAVKTYTFPTIFLDGGDDDERRPRVPQASPSADPVREPSNEDAPRQGPAGSL